MKTILIGVVLFCVWVCLGIIAFILDCEIDKHGSLKEADSNECIFYAFGGVVSFITVICKWGIEYFASFWEGK